MTDDPLLRVDGLATGYGDIRAVWDVSLRVHAGEVTVLLGRNGAGKTTTLRAVAGLNKAEAGCITFDGEDITGVRAHRRVGAGIAFVQEGKRVFRRRTVEENLLLGGYSTGKGKHKLRAELGPVYDMFPVLADRRRTVSGQLSGGQQQMLAIGQALMAKPALLMLDEPSGGLAPSVVAEVMATVSTLKASGMGVLLVEQAAAAALEVADQVTVLDVGKVVLDRPRAEVADTNALLDVYFGRAG
ncbi:ABC transporter ATP-binding protein [Prauserella marina]|uniref:Branched-chain amino acid transport system ATP-binding protein n=1 Tax=Prauserella marina TaxID=530584 RepID=A0A222VQU8_9PSEU|nr:ABC transporter ATP-binding protein [Prauserella marina]ASR36295.1 ABC transporter ATP-binding protein [Prauserella marina]PWV77073.1 amino acid/amide ABC transporter ATP-binding protein 2 (HAAT family) [Prauserella marina]SDD03765.1 branched-chain amino acid transport system ATP-binding protein [Prauserella marina]